MNLIELVEIHSKGKQYNPKTENCDVEYSLRVVYVNPAYIGMIREDEMHSRLHKNGNLIDGLNEGQDFSKLFLEYSKNSPASLTVVGSPETIIEKIKGNADGNVYPLC